VTIRAFIEGCAVQAVALLTGECAVEILEHLNGGSGNGGSDNADGNVYRELGSTDSASCGKATATTNREHLLPSFDVLPPPPYVAREFLSSYSVMSPGASSFILPNVVSAGHTQAMNAYYTQQQQQQQQLLTLSPFTASTDSLQYSSAGTGLHLVTQPPLSLLPASSSYCDAMAPTVRNISNGYWYPPGTDSRFSSKYLSSLLYLC